MADQSTVELEDSEDLVVTMKSGSDNELTVSVSAVSTPNALDTNVDDLTLTVGSKPVSSLTSPQLLRATKPGSQDLEIEEEIGTGELQDHDGQRRRCRR